MSVRALTCNDQDEAGDRKTYAYFDVIGIKKAFKEGNASELLSQFWKSTKQWVSRKVSDLGYLPLEGQNADKIPEVYLTVFSDAALLYTRDEHTLDAFYKIALDLLKFIKDEDKLNAYCIINRDKEITVPDNSSIGGYTVNSNNKPYYNRVVGSGAAWVNIYLADLAVKEKQEWHDKYTLYCVGKRTIADKSFSSSDSIKIKGFLGKKVEIYALTPKT